MTFLGVGILTWITFLPVVGMIVVLLMNKDNKAAIRWTALGVTVIQCVLAIIIYMGFNRSMAGINTPEGYQFLEKVSWIDIKGAGSWIGNVKIDYFLGIDGLSVLMVILTAIISFVAVISSWSIEKSLKGYF